MLSTLFAYIGPETILPTMSILAVIIGFALTFLSYVTWPFRKVYYVLTGKTPTPAAPASAPSGENQSE
ncbi:MAG: hypothetical protein L0Y72_09210 [Gemmataceae bacterium]|nr:hypothetical protein [Gemmataceae bacterium]MCI0739210.1 hypothetical protein [Gemmataceae bacterium]